jgi:hypothetical protein
MEGQGSARRRGGVEIEEGEESLEGIEGEVIGLIGVSHKGYI